MTDHSAVREQAASEPTTHVQDSDGAAYPVLAPAALKRAIHAGGELAVLDVREAGVVARRRILFAVPAPLWRLEVLIDRLVPRRSAPIVLVDGDGSLVREAAAKLARLGWNNLSLLEGGVDAWEAAGLEVYAGSNVLSKAFGEVIEIEKHTPAIDVDTLQAKVDAGENLVVVDSRTPEEFRDFSLPFAHSLPGGELVYRIGELAPDPETLVVVNCAGRTRSIVGAQTLIDAGIPNRVVSLKDGTMAWLLSGRELARGREAEWPEPGPESLAAARARAEGVARAAGVGRVDARALAELEADAAAGRRTLYRFDVRSREEYEAGHLEGWRWAPGGQLVQATDEYLATRGARVVIADWDGVRALTAGAWLAQLGAFEVHVFAPPADATLVPGPETIRVQPPRAAVRAIPPRAAARLIKSGAPAFDVDRRVAFERRHAAGAWFAVPDRLEEFVAAVPGDRTVLIFSGDGVLARGVAAELAHRTGRDVRPVSGGTQAWSAAGLPVETGAEGVLTGEDDAWRSPYHHAERAAREAGFRAYLEWEVGLADQLRREGETGIRLIERGGAR